MRIKVNANEFQAFSISVFLMFSFNMQYLLAGLGRYKRSLRMPKAARLATSTRDFRPAEVEPFDSSVERKKSALYTKTGDKGMSSVSSHDPYPQSSLPMMC
jgi:hypothetical protein